MSDLYDTDTLTWSERHRRALRSLPATVDGQPPLPVPAVCPVTFEELLAEPPEA